MKRPKEPETNKFYGMNNQQKNVHIEDLNKYIDYLEANSDLKAKEAYEAAKYHTVPQMTYEQWKEKQRTMIQADELMIGNYVMDKYPSGKPFLHKLNEAGLANILIDPYDQKEISPIPITKQWLLDFGFEIRQTNGGFEEWKKEGFYLLDGRVPLISRKFPSIEHIHQLQNLYFALTGEQLKKKGDHKPNI